MVCYPTIVLSATLTKSQWYFDSGSSRYMTGNVSHLSSVISHSGSVIFGDGQKRKINGRGTLSVLGLPHLDDVLLVQGLKANPISISQLCDQNWNVSFNKGQCQVLDKANHIVMKEAGTDYGQIDKGSSQGYQSYSDRAVSRGGGHRLNGMNSDGEHRRIKKNHHVDNIIGDPTVGIRTRSKIINNLIELTNFSCYTSKIKPKNVKEALQDDLWIKAMQEELRQFERNQVWDLVPKQEGLNVIGTKWIFKNKTDEAGNVA
ncbi:uncharacterized protein LOC116020206 [Ipomoea triloba]|uniref:uncharacterized protein LOC116020206 n=1 Tax=Ipomoea triloba TaxID=35885 RepID=UPI00125E2182|nr:uncharacterized protein LOC116020206 [Ipomoea triloba]